LVVDLAGEKSTILRGVAEEQVTLEQEKLERARYCFIR
jgi:hypothetical protein